MVNLPVTSFNPKKRLTFVILLLYSFILYLFCLVVIEVPVFNASTADILLNLLSIRLQKNITAINTITAPINGIKTLKVFFLLYPYKD